MTLKKNAKIYFMGIGGTGMASVAGLCKEAGFDVVGSDMNMYPPMSTMLDELKISVRTPYSADNIAKENPDLVIVANALSRGHIELESALEKNVSYTSFPKLLGDEFLSKRDTIVVSGTHGKTTTTSLLSFMLYELGEDPGFVIGGIPKNFPRSFRLGKGRTFAIEGDEYDTAFFDKGPKFLHYHPKFLIVNNIEFDHADIYKNVEAIEEQFAKLMNLVPKDGAIIANMEDAHVKKTVEQAKPAAKIYPKAKVIKFYGKEETKGHQTWYANIETKNFGILSIETTLTGAHNMANIAQVITCIEALHEAKVLKNKLSGESIVSTLKKFDGVTRRLEFLGSHNDIDVFEDFAHHPTAVATVIQGYRDVHPKRRLVVAYEPKNATSRRNVFHDQYVKSFGLADEVLIGPCPDDKRIQSDQKMDTKKLADDIGKKAKAFSTNEDLLNYLKSTLHSGDTVIFMSSSSFSGIQHQLVKILHKI